MYQNVEYELYELEKLITGDSPGAHEPESAYAATRPKPNAVRNEACRIRRSIMQNIFIFEDDARIARYIQFHQRALIALMDRTFRLGDSTSFQRCYKDMADLLAFLEGNFTKYFDENVKAPEQVVSDLRAGIRSGLAAVERKLDEGAANETIAALLLAPLKKFAHSRPHAEVTYRKLRFITRADRHLFKIIHACTRNDIDRELRRTMYYLDYNSKKCFQYVAGSITELLSRSETNHEKIEQSSYLLKEVNQLSVRIGMSLCPDEPSLKNKVSLFIMEEMKHLERMQRVDLVPPLLSGGNHSPDFKVKLELSVSQLAFLLRLMLDAGIILNKNIAPLITCVAGFAMTKRSENVSAGSLRSKFYEVEDSTGESVRAVLVRMLQFIKSSPESI